jgi:hypothetical protein
MEEKACADCSCYYIPAPVANHHRKTNKQKQKIKI